MIEAGSSELFETTNDAFLDGTIIARQPKNGFRSGMDAVFLAAACQAKPDQRVLDVGCGAGVASLCLLARIKNLVMTGIEIEPQIAQLARYNANANGFGSAMSVISADVTQSWQSFEQLGLAPNSHHHVIANPPFYDPSRTRQAPDAYRERAHAMQDGALDSWFRFISTVMIAKGICTIIHVPAMLDRLLESMKNRFGGIGITPIYPRSGSDAIRVILTGMKGSRASIALRSGIVLHEEDGQPTQAAQAILRHGAGLFDVVT